jgi:hypothetical protein
MSWILADSYSDYRIGQKSQIVTLLVRNAELANTPSLSDYLLRMTNWPTPTLLDYLRRILKWWNMHPVGLVSLLVTLAMVPLGCS